MSGTVEPAPLARRSQLPLWAGAQRHPKRRSRAFQGNEHPLLQNATEGLTCKPLNDRSQSRITDVAVFVDLAGRVRKTGILSQEDRARHSWRSTVQQVRCECLWQPTAVSAQHPDGHSFQVAIWNLEHGASKEGRSRIIEREPMVL